MLTDITPVTIQAARQRVFEDYYALRAAKAATGRFAANVNNSGLLQSFNAAEAQKVVDAASAELVTQGRIEWADMYAGKNDPVLDDLAFGIWGEFPTPVLNTMTYTQLANLEQGAMAKRGWFRFITRLRKADDWALIKYCLQLYRSLQRIGMNDARILATSALCVAAKPEDIEWYTNLLRCYQCPAFEDYCTKQYPVAHPGALAWAAFLSAEKCPRGLWAGSTDTIYDRFVDEAVEDRTLYIFTVLAGGLSELLLSIQAAEQSTAKMTNDAYGRQSMIERAWET